MANLGGILLLFSLPFLGWLAIDEVDYQYWPADGEFRGGQAAHVVAVGEGETFVLWRFEPIERPRCEVTSVPSGEPIELKDVSSEGRIRGAGATYFLAFAEGRSDSAYVSVSCARIAEVSVNGPEWYYIDDPSFGPAWLAGTGPLWPIPFALVIAGFTLLGASVVVRIQNARRARLSRAAVV